jgi:hypothetical protein
MRLDKKEGENGRDMGSGEGRGAEGKRCMGENTGEA